MDGCQGVAMELQTCVCVQYVVATVLWVVVKVLGVVVKVLLCNLKGVLIVRLAVFWVVARAWL